MSDFIKQYPTFVAAVIAQHTSRKMAHGHDFDHAFGVANLAAGFCEEPGYSYLAWLAGMCHNADRMIAKDLGKPRGDVDPQLVKIMVRGWLDAEPSLSETDKAMVDIAVRRHGEPNDASDDFVTRALKDADRVINARIDVIIRSAQFHPELPVIDPVLGMHDTRGRYNGRLTVIADLMDCLDWGNLADKRFGIRTFRAKTLIVERVAKLREYLEGIAGSKGLQHVVTIAQENRDLPVIDPVLLLKDTGAKTVMSKLLAFLIDEELTKPGTRKLSRSDRETLHSFVNLIVKQRREEGLVPYPFQ